MDKITGETRDISEIVNPHNLKEDQTVILDEGKLTESKVCIIWMSPKQMYSIVCVVGNINISWRVMTMRLTPKVK